MNDLLIPKIKKTLAVIERTCKKLHQEETLDDGEIYHAAKVRLLPRQTVVSTPLTTITYERNDVTRHQPGKALLAGTSTAGLPASAKTAGNMDEMILFFGLPKGSHINIVTDSGLEWLDKDIKGTTYALVLTELPRGKYIVSMNSTTFRVELK